ncbi:MAG: CDP-archaeol synthase [Clostridia bacterium]|nr:CDP-archaeol synthase [Clostridia bacterium]
MKKKLLVGSFWGVVGILLLCFQFTPAFSLAIAFFTAVASYEILNVAQVKNKAMITLSCITAALIPLIVDYNADFGFLSKIPISTASLILIYLFLQVIFMFTRFEKTRFEHVTMSMFSGLVIPYLMSRLIVIRDLHQAYPEFYTRSNAAYLTLSVLVCCWITDTMSFIFGSKLGKHKMAPKISPKKTWEGAVGGLLGTTVINVIVWLVFFALSKLGWITPIFMPVWAVPIFTIILSAISMIGDLAASTIKRNYGIKDFGKLMGDTHGGVMDRFDSAVYVCGAAYIFIEIFEYFRLS